MLETKDKITLLNLQVALFFSKPLKEQFGKLAMKINKDMSNMFDEMPFMFPADTNAPANVPIFELASSTKQYRCTASKQRADIYYSVLTSLRDKDFNYHRQEYSDKVTVFFDSLQSWTEIGDIVRIGYITNFFLFNESPTDRLTEVFMKTGKFDKNLTELNIRFNCKEQRNSFELNNITKLDTSEIADTKERGILIQRDINTVVEKQYKFDRPMFDKFKNTTESFLTFEQIQKVVN